MSGGSDGPSALAPLAPLAVCKHHPGVAFTSPSCPVCAVERSLALTQRQLLVARCELVERFDAERKDQEWKRPAPEATP